MALNDISAAHEKQYAALELLFADNTAAVDAKPAFATRRGIFGDQMVQGALYIDASNVSTRGYTTSKKAARRTSSISGSNLAGKGVSYAILKENTTLEEQMEQYSQSFLYKTADTDYAAKIQDIADTLSPFITSDPTISAEFFDADQITAMQLDKTNYLITVGLFKSAKLGVDTGKKNYKVLQIPAMKVNITFLEGFLTDLSVAYPDFVLEFKAIVAKLNVIGKRNQGVTASMVYDGTGLPIVLTGTFEITNYPPVKKAKKANTNSMGLITIMKLKIGTWEGIFKAPGCEDQIASVVVKSKTIVNLVIRMKLL